MRTARGLCLIASIFASLFETLAVTDSTLFNLHVDETNTLVTQPRFSWNITSHDTQTSYRIQVSSSRDQFHDVWDSGVVHSSGSVAEYSGPSFSPGTHYFWRVDVGTTGSSAFASSDFTTDYSPFHESSRELRRRQTTNLGTLTTAFKTGTWIWTADGAPPLYLAAPGNRYFRRTYTPPTGKNAILAEIIITADNEYTLYVNGAQAGASPSDADSWETAQGYQMALSPGPVVFAVAATNAPTATGAANAAGLLVAIRITLSDASQVLIGSDGQWVSNVLAVPSFQLPSTDVSTWVAATLIAKFGSGPWLLSVTLPTVLTTVTLPAASTSSALPSTSSTLPLSSSTSSSLPLTTSSTITSSSDSSLSTSTSSVALITSLSTVVVTQTSQDATAGATAPAASTSPGSATKSSSKSALVGGVLGGVIGAFALLGLAFVFWRRRQHMKEELSAADFDTWVPAPHAASNAPSTNSSTAPFMSQAPGPSRSPAPPSTLRQPQYESTSEQYVQPQAPYRYPPPSSSLANAVDADTYAPQFVSAAAGYGRASPAYGGAASSGGYGGYAYGGDGTTYGVNGYATGQDYGSSTHLVPSQNGTGGGSVPQALTPGSSQGYYPSTNPGQGSNTNSYGRGYY